MVDWVRFPDFVRFVSTKRQTTKRRNKNLSFDHKKRDKHKHNQFEHWFVPSITIHTLFLIKIPIDCHTQIETVSLFRRSEQKNTIKNHQTMKKVNKNGERLNGICEMKRIRFGIWKKTDSNIHFFERSLFLTKLPTHALQTNRRSFVTNPLFKDLIDIKRIMILCPFHNQFFHHRFVCIRSSITFRTFLDERISLLKNKWTTKKARVLSCRNSKKNKCKLESDERWFVVQIFRPQRTVKQKQFRNNANWQ